MTGAAQSLGDADECVGCGREIGAERRKALPHAIRCVGCQELVERPRGKREKSL